MCIRDRAIRGRGGNAGPGYGNWAPSWGAGTRDHSDYFDFFDYVVDFQTPRPPPRPPVRRKARRQRKKIKHGRSRPPAINHQQSTKRRPGVVFDYVEVVGQSRDVETTDAGHGGTSAQSFRRRGGSEHRRLPQSVPVWIARSQLPYRREPMNILANSAVHLAATVGRARGAGFWKEGKDVDSEAKSVEPW